VLFYGEEVSPEPMNFRGLFLRSAALEKVVNNFIETPPTEEEADLLLQLFGATATCRVYINIFIHPVTLGAFTI
jgi:hypothetical protein